MTQPSYPVVILAGGKGTRISEKTKETPKPMLMVGDKPLLMHIIDIYASQGLHEFIIPTGYKGEYIFAYFTSLFEGEVHKTSYGLTGRIDDIVVSIIDTGNDTQTGGRIKRLEPYIDGPFYLTYGDGLANINLHNLKRIFENDANIVTLTAVHPLPRFGSVQFYSPYRNTITKFGEKQDNLGWVNGGFMLCHPKLFNLIESDEINLESDVLPALAQVGMLNGYKHEGYWQCVDTLRDLENLQQIYSEQGAIWLNIG